jgi:hypothetical protein
MRGRTRGQVGALPLVALLGITACSSGYRAGSFAGAGHSFAGELRTVGCLDLGVESIADERAEGPAARITVANRCDTTVPVDLGAVVAIGRYADGRALELRAYDPDAQIRVARIGARRVIRESIEYHPPPAAGWPDLLCLDLGAVDAGARSRSTVIACVTTDAPAIAWRGAP